MISTITQLLEAAKRKHGLESIVGVRRENICTRDLGMYFRALGARLDARGLDDVFSSDLESAAFQLESKARKVCRELQPILLETLVVNLYAGMLEGDAHLQVEPRLIRTREADGDLPDDVARVLGQTTATTLGGRQLARSITPVLKRIDRLGLSGTEAADYAAQHAGDLVKGLDEQTVALLRTIVDRGIRERLSNEVVARMIRDELGNMSIVRARLIAATEMNDAFSEAALRKMYRLGVEYKRLSIAAGACQRCRDIAAAGPIPVRQPFIGGKLRTPIHPKCRCATVSSRPPKGA